MSFVLRRMSLTGDALACAILPGAAVGFLVSGLSLGAMTIGGLIAGMAVALLSGFVSRLTALREDASLAAFYLISLAIGVLIVSTRGSNIDLMHVLFGTVLADNAALILLCSITSLSVVTLAIFFVPCFRMRRPTVLAFGKRSQCNYALYVPDPRSDELSRRISNTWNSYGRWHNDTARCCSTFLDVKYWGTRSLAIVLALLSSFVGLLLSFYYECALGPAIILVAGVAYSLSLACGSVDGVITQLSRRSPIR